jgi:nucleolar protein 58
MLILYETPGGYALFKARDTKALGKVTPEKMQNELFGDSKAAGKQIKLAAFSKFEDTAEAVAAATATVNSELGKSLKKFLTKNVVKKGLDDELVVADPKIAAVIKEKLGVQCKHDLLSNELLRCVRTHSDTLLDEVSEADMRTMRLGLSHSLSRYKLKFSPDKVDVMVIQAIGLLDELDKEINTCVEKRTLLLLLLLLLVVLLLLLRPRCCCRPPRRGPADVLLQQLLLLLQQHYYYS